MSRTGTITIASIAIGLFGYALVTLQASARHSPSVGTEQSEHSAASPRPDRSQQVRSSGVAPDRSVARPRFERVSPVPANADPSPSRSAAPTANDIAEIEAREVQRALKFYTSSHGRESSDPSWSRQQEEQISEFLSDEAFAGVSLEETDCRTSQCRVVVMHQDEGSLRRLDKAWGHGPFRHGGYSHFDEQTQSTTVYLGREGREFQYPDLGPLSDD